MIPRAPMKIQIGILALIVACAVVPLRAQDKQEDQPSPSVTDLATPEQPKNPALENDPNQNDHRAAKPAETSRLKRNKEHWERLSPEQRQQWMAHFREWRKFSPEERARIHRNFQHWETMSPVQREWIRKNHNRLQTMPPEKRARILKNLQRWRAMTPEQREQIRHHLRERAEAPPPK